MECSKMKKHNVFIYKKKELGASSLESIFNLEWLHNIKLPTKY